MRKIGKIGKTSPWLYVIGLALIALVAVLIYGVAQVARPPIEEELVLPGECEIAPSINLAISDAVNPGTAVTSVTNDTLLNDKYVGTLPTSFQKGDMLKVIVGKTNYLDTLVEFGPLMCGKNTLYGDLYATDASTLKVFNDDGNVVTDAVGGGAVNQSASATPIQMEIKLTANSDESSGNLVIVVEATNTTQVDDMILSGEGVTKTDVPEFYTVAGAGSIAKAYDVTAVVDGASKVIFLNIQPESGATIDGTGFYVTAHSKQAFVDVDGSFDYGVEDSDGTAKYEDTYDYDFIVT